MLKGYVKNTSNCQGLPLGWDAGVRVVEELGNHTAAIVKTGEDLRKRKVVGWTDLFFGKPTSIDAYRVEWQSRAGILICGGNSGIRILAKRGDPEAREPGVDDHLPNGWGMPILFIEDESDLVKLED